MWLSGAEAKQLSACSGSLVLWRFKVRVANCTVGSVYYSGGVPYTVISKELRDREKVRELHSQRIRERVWELWKAPENRRHREVWEIVLVLGDLSDSPRWMAPTGSGSDYTTQRFRAMPDEGPALSAKELAKLTRSG